MVLKILSLFLAITLIQGMIQGTEDVFKAERYATVGYPVLVDGFAVDVQQRNDGNDELEELPVPSQALIYHGRFRRAIRDPIAEFLDDKAAEEVFNDVHPPAPPNFSDLIDTQQSNSFEDDDLPFENDVPVKTTTQRIPRLPEGPPPTSPNANTGREMKPFDFNVDPDFPTEAPRARGLINIPEGWNSDRQVDEEFRHGFRWNTEHISPSTTSKPWDLLRSERQIDQSYRQQGFPVFRRQ